MSLAALALAGVQEIRDGAIVRRNDSGIAFEAVSISINATPTGAWSVEASCRLRGGADTVGPIVLGMRDSPLVITRVVSDPEADAIEVPVPANSDMVLEARQNGKSWAGTRLILSLEWNPEVRSHLVVDKLRGTGLVAPCLALPEMLPSIREVERPIQTFSRKRPKIQFASDLPNVLDAGGVAIPDWRGRPTSVLLQTVICQSNISAPTSSAIAVTIAQNGQGVKLESAAHQRLVAMVDFIATALCVSLPVRPVVCVIDNYATHYPNVGAFCPILVGDVEIGVRNVQRDLNTIMQLAQSWFDAGVRIWGENSLALRLGVGIGLGLKWLERVMERSDFDRAIADLRAAVRAPNAGEEPSPADVARAIGLSAFEAGRTGGLWRVLGKLLRRKWGEHVAQEEFIELLRGANVAVPHVFG